MNATSKKNGRKSRVARITFNLFAHVIHFHQKQWPLVAMQKVKLQRETDFNRRDL